MSSDVEGAESAFRMFPSSPLLTSSVCRSRLEEEPRAVAFNPWGYQLIVALPQRVFVFDILVDR